MQLLIRILIVVCFPIFLIGCGVPEGERREPITYWRTLTGEAGDMQDKLAEQFNWSQDAVRVTVEFQGGYGDLAAKLMTAAAAGTGPDLTQLGTYEIREFARAGLLIDLTDYIDGPEGIDTSDWSGTMLEAGRIDGKLYWLPFNVSSPVLWYDTRAFEAAGLDGPPETWDEFFDFARRLTLRKSDGSVERPGLALWDSTWPILSMVWSEGGEVTTPDYSNITIDHPVTIGLFKRLQSLKADGALVVPTELFANHRDLFIMQRVAMTLDSSAAFDWGELRVMTFWHAAAPYPAGARGRVYAPGGGGIAMLARTPGDKRDAAWSYMRFLLQPEQIAHYAYRSGYCAFSESAQAEDRFDHPRWKVIHESLQHVRGDFSVNMSPAVRDAFDEAFQRILVRGEHVETVLREADAKAERDVQRELAAR